MNRTQINYIRECLALRKRRMMSKHCVTPPTPQEVIDADQVVKQWSEYRARYTSRIRTAIEDRIHALEEMLILGDSSEQLQAALRELDNWVPTDSNDPAQPVPIND